MPTYDYICDDCAHEFEAFESIKADPQTVCPSCGQPKLRRKIGPGAAVLFKGSGFYQTDYRSESYKQAAKSDKPTSESSSTPPKGDGGSSGSSSTSTAPAASPPASSSGPSNGKP